MADRSRESATFMANSTWLGGLLPLLQAEPLLQAIPARSSAISID
jgi:hypothetical protein